MGQDTGDLYGTESHSSSNFIPLGGEGARASTNSGVYGGNASYQAGVNKFFLPASVSLRVRQ